MSRLLLKGGTVLVHDEHDNLSPQRIDILLQGDRIQELGKPIEAQEGCEVMDCTDKIISPGFVDTHHHMWETSLKGIAEDETAPNYFATMFTAPFTLGPKDVFWGNLSGCLEAIDAGTTTALDFAHVNWTEKHSKQALAGTLSSGLRSVFAYSTSVTVRYTEPKVELEELIPAWFWPCLQQVAQSRALSSEGARVRLGLGFDYYFLPEGVVKDTFQKARQLGVDLITSHCAKTPGNDSAGIPSLLKSYGLLDNRIVLSHLGGADAADVKLLREANAFISASPSTEMTMGLGPPCAFRHDMPEIDAVCSIGVDCHCTTSSSMVNEMRVGLLAARGNHAIDSIRQGSLPKTVCRTSQDAFNMGTIQGARALNMENDIGTIAVGKKADLVMFESLTPAMTVAAQTDPVKAIVMHSSINDINAVIVDGRIRKLDGKLLPVALVDWQEESGDFVDVEKEIGWNEIAKVVLEVRERFTSRLGEFDLDKLSTFVKELYQL